MEACVRHIFGCLQKTVGSEMMDKLLFIAIAVIRILAFLHQFPQTLVIGRHEEGQVTPEHAVGSIREKEY